VPPGVRIHSKRRTGLLRIPDENGGEAEKSAKRRHHSDIFLERAPEIQEDLIR
jgi:hypothetical protein